MTLSATYTTDKRTNDLGLAYDVFFPLDKGEPWTANLKRHQKAGDSILLCRNGEAKECVIESISDVQTFGHPAGGGCIKQLVLSVK